MNKQAKNTKQKQATAVTWRFALVISLIVFVYLGLATRSAYIQVIEPDMLQKHAANRVIRNSTSVTQRGSVVDRNGRELAISVPVETIWADPKVVMSNNSLDMVKHWEAMADVLAKDVNVLTDRIVKNSSKRFVYLERQVSPAMADYIKALKIPGVHLRQESKRFYPAGEISAHVVGFTNVDDKGIEGIERLYNKVLTGTAGAKKFIKDAKGRKVEILSEEKAQAPEDITLSIDQRIQALAYKELKGAVEAFKATSGSVVVTNVHTGEILALVNSPSYNPNNLTNTATHRLRNRAITDSYEPGSTMKPLAMLAALEFGSFEHESIINTSPGWMRLGGRRVSDPINRGKLSLKDILVKSSNMGTTKLALSVPKTFLLDKFFDAGFGSDTGTNLLGESAGIMHDRPRWSKFELATLSFGYGLTVTPIQLARLYSTFGNGGVRIPLTILKTDEPAHGERVFSEKESQFLLTMLEAVVAEGGASKALVDGYRVGGKTGTSRKAANGSYGNDYVGLFAGVAPISKPELAVVVVINEPGGDLYHGGDVAAPVFGRIMKGALHILNIAPDQVINLQTATSVLPQTNKVMLYV